MKCAKTLHYIGTVYESQGKYDGALKNYKNSSTIKERLVGKDSLYYARTIRNIGNIYQNQKKYDDALKNYKEA